MSEADFVMRKRVARMEKIDQMPPKVRALVHDYGLHVVNTLLEAGVTNPRHIRHVVEAILDEFSPTRGSFSGQGIRVGRMGPKDTPTP